MGELELIEDTWILETENIIKVCSDCGTELDLIQGFFYCANTEIVRCRNCDLKYNCKYTRGEEFHNHYCIHKIRKI